MMLIIASFTEEEISTMRRELDKYGITMPSFGKIGGILTSEVCYMLPMLTVPHSILSPLLASFSGQALHCIAVICIAS